MTAAMAWTLVPGCKDFTRLASSDPLTKKARRRAAAMPTLKPWLQRSQILGSQARVLRNAAQNLPAQLVIVVEGANS
jgi:hypothetical protein